MTTFFLLVHLENLCHSHSGLIFFVRVSRERNSTLSFYWSVQITRRRFVILILNYTVMLRFELGTHSIGKLKEEIRVSEKKDENPRKYRERMQMSPREFITYAPECNVCAYIELT